MLLAGTMFAKPHLRWGWQSSDVVFPSLTCKRRSPQPPKNKSVIINQAKNREEKHNHPPNIQVYRRLLNLLNPNQWSPTRRLLNLLNLLKTNQWFPTRSSTSPKLQDSESWHHHQQKLSKKSEARRGTTPQAQEILQQEETSIHKAGKALRRCRGCCLSPGQPFWAWASTFAPCGFAYCRCRGSWNQRRESGRLPAKAEIYQGKHTWHGCRLDLLCCKIDFEIKVPVFDGW